MRIQVISLLLMFLMTNVPVGCKEFDETTPTPFPTEEATPYPTADMSEVIPIENPTSTPDAESANVIDGFEFPYPLISVRNDEHFGNYCSTDNQTLSDPMTIQFLNTTVEVVTSNEERTVLEITADGNGWIHHLVNGNFLDYGEGLIIANCNGQLQSVSVEHPPQLSELVAFAAVLNSDANACTNLDSWNEFRSLPYTIHTNNGTIFVDTLSVTSNLTDVDGEPMGGTAFLNENEWLTTNLRNEVRTFSLFGVLRCNNKMYWSYNLIPDPNAPQSFSFGNKPS